MTNLIAKVAELRKLEAKATPSPWFMWDNDPSTDSTAIAREPKNGSDMSCHEVLGCSEWLRVEPIDLDLFVALRNAAPRMLAALEKVQAGDMSMIENIISCMKTLSMDEYGEYTNSYDNEIAFLRRYADLARMMEGSP